MTERRFAMVPHTLLHLANGKLLSGGDWSVLLAVLAHRNTKTGVAYPGIARLVQFTGLSRSQVKRSVRALGKSGLLDIAHVPGLGSQYYLPGELPIEKENLRIHRAPITLEN